MRVGERGTPMRSRTNWGLMVFSSVRVLPFISSVKREAEALEMAQPSPVNATSSTEAVLLFFDAHLFVSSGFPRSRE